MRGNKCTLKQMINDHYTII